METGIDVKKAEEVYKAIYLGDFCLKTKSGQWALQLAAVFYCPEPDFEAGHSFFFALFTDRHENMYIADANHVFDEPIIGIKADNGQIIYSRHRHDYRVSNDKSVFIDGGRDYTKTNRPDRLLDLDASYFIGEANESAR
jgi:hypothetical protein